MTGLEELRPKLIYIVVTALSLYGILSDSGALQKVKLNDGNEGKRVNVSELHLKPPTFAQWKVTVSVNLDNWTLDNILYRTC